MRFVPSSISVPYRALFLTALLGACSDGAGTLAPDPGSYNPVASGGARGSASAGQAGFAPGSNSSSGGAPATITGNGGSGPAAAGMQGGVANAPNGSGGSGAAAGTFASGVPNGTGGSVGAGGSFGSGGLGSGGAPFGGSGGTAFGGAVNGAAGHAGALTQGGAGKQGTAGAPADVPATFSAVSSIIQANCAVCHGSRTPRLTNNANLYKTLTSTTVKECGGNALVKPNDPANSALLMLPNWECDDLVMPQGCVDAPCLTDSELATITAWINAGAPSK